MNQKLLPSAELLMPPTGIRFPSELHHLQGYTQIHTSMDSVVQPVGVPWDGAGAVYESVITCDVTLATFQHRLSTSLTRRLIASPHKHTHPTGKYTQAKCASAHPKIYVSLEIEHWNFFDHNL